ncbi:MAG: YARHG domain-containing protein [Pseudomonadota bacterium]
MSAPSFNCLRDILVVGAFAGAVLAAPGSGRANDVAFGGSGADLVPITETRVTMVAEDILIERVAKGGYAIMGDGYWRVRARYTFRNTEAKAVTIQIGFPEPACPEDGDCSFAGFENLVTRVRGSEVALRLGSVASDHDWTAHINKAHLFDVTFAPGETVEIEHTYRHGLSEHINGGEDLTYITRTGALWAGAIGSARFRIRLPFRPWGMVLGDWADSLSGFAASSDANGAQTELTFTRTEWEPAGDMRLAFGPGLATLDTTALIAGCPAPMDIFDSEVAPDSVDSAALQKAVSGLSDEKLRLCRNAVFARHGRAFKDASLNEFFYGGGAFRLHEAGTLFGVPVYSVFARDPFYSDALPGPEDRAYAEALLSVEKAR